MLNKYNYTQDWFSNSEIKGSLFKFIDKKNKYSILEIGCFEGLSTCFFSDNIMDHPSSTIDCVDPFYITGTYPGITSQFIDSTTKNTFKNNIKKSKNYNKITFHNETSDEFFKKQKNTYNFIYIDGCHECDYVKRDIENSFKILEKDGIMWMDDYLGGNNYNIKKTIDDFLEKNNTKLDIIHKSYQLAIKKY